AALSGNRMVVVWESNVDSSTFQFNVVGRILQFSGAALTATTPEFPLNATTGDLNTLPDVAALPSGNFVAVWGTENLPASSIGKIQAGTFNGTNGTPLSAETTISGSNTTPNQNRPRVAALNNGTDNVVVTWNATGLDSDASAIAGQILLIPSGDMTIAPQAAT